MRFFKHSLAMAVFLMICYGFSTVSADEYEISISGTTEVFIPEHGNGTLHFDIWADSGDHSNLELSVLFGSDEWSEDYEISGCNGNDFDNSSLDEGDWTPVCIFLTVPEEDVQIGDQVGYEIFIQSEEDSEGDSSEGTIVVSNWRSGNPDTNGDSIYDFETTHSYFFVVYNQKVDENGDPVPLDDPVYIEIIDLPFEFHMSSNDDSWDPMEMKATIDYIDSYDSYTFWFDVRLIDNRAPASSYIGSNPSITFRVNDGAVSIYSSIEMIVLDNFSIYVPQNEETERVDNGCMDSGEIESAALLYWEVDINNYGNTIDTFSISFDFSNLPTQWGVSRADDGFNELPSSTGPLLPKFEDGKFSFSLEMEVPNGLTAGISHGFNVTIVSDNDSNVVHLASFTATVLECYDIRLSLASQQDSMLIRLQQQYVINFNMTNKGNSWVEPELKLSGNSAGWLSLPKDVVIAPGKTISLPVTVSPEVSTRVNFTFYITAEIYEGGPFVIYDSVSPDFTIWIEPPTPPNLALEQFTSDHLDVSEGQVVRFTVIVFNDGETKATGKILLKQGSSEMILGVIEFTVAGLESVIVSYDYSIPVKYDGELTIRAQIDRDSVSCIETSLNFCTLGPSDIIEDDYRDLNLNVRSTVDIPDSANTTEDTTSKEEDYEGDEAGECSDEADNDKDGLFDCDDDTCAGSPACKATDSTEGLSSLSFVPALISIGLLAIFRRK